MSLTPGQAQFASVFAHETGLDPKVVGAWMLAEQSGSAAKFYEGKGYHNWLNIANTDSGPASGAHSSVWRNPITAAKASAEWMRGQGRIAHEYGAPASGIQAILKAGSNPYRQIQAIAHSGWASSGYNGGSTLMQLMKSVGNIPSPSPQQAVQATRAAAIPGVTGRTEVDPQRAAALQNAASLFAGKGSGNELLHQALEAASAKAAEPGPQKVLSTPAGPHVVRQGSPDPQASNNLHGILPPGAKIIAMSRKDQGRDVQLNPGQDLLAPGKFVFLGTKSDPHGFGPDYPVIRVLTGEFAGHDLYYGHTDVAHGLRPGKVYEAGTHVATTSTTGHNAKPGWLELGFAPGGTPGKWGQPTPF